MKKKIIIIIEDTVKLHLNIYNITFIYFMIDYTILYYTILMSNEGRHFCKNQYK